MPSSSESLRQLATESDVFVFLFLKSGTLSSFTTERIFEDWDFVYDFTTELNQRRLRFHHEKHDWLVVWLPSILFSHILGIHHPN